MYILTSKCASRHNGVYFFHIPTSNSGPNVVCFVHFELEMSFAPQRRALFRHLNFQKGSEREVFLAFSLANVLRATTVCNFSSLIWPDGSAPRSHKSLEKHSVLRFSYLFGHLDLRSRLSLFDLLSSSLLFSSLLFPSLPFPSLRFASLLFSSLLFSSLLFSSLTLTTSAFHLSILSEV